MPLVVYNTLTREKEPFATLQAGVVRMYVCGPTVYDEAHVGHAMSSIVFDFVRRYLEHKGYQVRHVMNFTDVDDKIIARAEKSGEDPFVIANRYVEKYQAQLDALNVLRPVVFPRVSQTIPEIVKMIQGLIDTDHAYTTGSGDVYFRVRSFPEYGKLSHRKLEEAVSGTRVATSEDKLSEGDFALWKAAKPGEPSWDSPWGPGRPGWHIECSAMNLRYLGEQIDIHGGGNDLIFPHHENEIAQTESYTGKPFARYWMHNGMLQLKGEKMSKSVGNIRTLRSILDRHRPEALITAFLGSHYRSPWEFSEDLLAETEQQV
ncbi:MAG TPA: cysteine--tRNA ligase, partial [Anaerolineae bacterium]